MINIIAADFPSELTGESEGTTSLQWRQMGAMASQITSLTIVYSTFYSDADKKTSKLRITGLCAGNSPVTGDPAQGASNAGNVSI